MAIERIGAGTAIKSAKKAAKHAVDKHAAKKHPAKKHAFKKHASPKHAAKKHALVGKDHKSMRRHVDEGGNADEGNDLHLTAAFHHLHRATAVISLLEEDSGGDLRMLLEQGMELYRGATGARRKDTAATCASGLLRAAEHLGMAGLYAARNEYRVKVAPPLRNEVARHLRELGPRLDALKEPELESAERLCSMARELLHRASQAQHDPHLEYELTMAADGICSALEEGI